MSFCIMCSLCELHCSQQINQGQQHPLTSELTKELEDPRKFSLNLLMALLPVFALSGSKLLQPVMLALLIYTISLPLAVNVCFIQTYPTLSRFLHSIPLLGTSCMVGVELIFDVQSPILTAIALLLSVLPLIITVVHHGKQCVEPATVVLPIRVWDPPATMSDTTAVSSSIGSVAKAGGCDIC